jgi:soluble lytic murein transglycosylase
VNRFAVSFLFLVAAAGEVAKAQTSAQSAAIWHAALAARQALRDSQPPDSQVLRAVDAELKLGRPDRARLLLARHSVTDPQFAGERLTAEAEGAYALGDFSHAGELFISAAERATGRVRGSLAARAGDALARAGKPADAAAQYRAAREDLPQIKSWLSLREAQVTSDTAVAFSLLEHAPEAARRLIPRVRAESFVLIGDTARAVVILAGAGNDGRAATLALATGDTANARQLAYRALRSGDTAISNVGIQLASTAVPPRTADEFVAVGRALRRQAPARAASLLGSAVAAGDRSGRTLLLWGDILTEAGNHEAALSAYAAAAASGSPEAAQGRFLEGRSLIRLGRPVGAFDTLARFVKEYPAHSSTPVASFLMADLRHEAGRREEADSLYRVVMERWPAHEYASQARIRLAGRALLRGDTLQAIELYRGEVDARGGQQSVARYLLGDLVARRSDSVAAQGYWSALARSDSLGYYGSLARTRLGWNPPVIDPVPTRVRAADVASSLEELDLLDEIGFNAEANTLVEWLVAEAGDGDRALDLAEGLAARGRTVQSISLGWRVARVRTLNDPRVLRAIYPWPLREIVNAEAREFDVDPYLLAALIRQESSFDIDARSRAGARGLMQVMPGTARQAARRMGLEWSDHLLHVPDANLHVGAAHLAILLRHYAGNPVPTLAAYNAGLTPVEIWRRFPEAKDPALFVERIPYAETRGYVRSVLRNWTIYRALYPPTS